MPEVGAVIVRLPKSFIAVPKRLVLLRSKSIDCLGRMLSCIWLPGAFVRLDSVFPGSMFRV